MSWTDEEIDKVFEEASKQQSFEYRQEYWKEFEKQLPVNKSKRPLAWWIAGNMFLAIFIGWTIAESLHGKIAVKENNLKAHVPHGTLSEKVGEKTVGQKVKAFENHVFQVVEKESPNYEMNIDVQSTAPILPIDRKSNEFSPFVSAIEANLMLDERKNGNNHTDSESQFVRFDEQAGISSKQTENNSAPNMEVRPLESSFYDASLIPSNLGLSKPNRIKLYAEVNGGVGQGWMSSKEASRSVNGTVGLAAGISLPLSKFNVNVGLGFQATKFDDLKIKERTKIYGFGSSILENTYQFNSIYAVTLPVQIDYSLGRHTLALGLTSSVNLFSRLKRTEEVDGIQTANRSGIAKVDLFSKVRLEPTVGYSFAVNENMNIGLRIGMNVIQPIQSDRFVGTPIKLPMHGQVYLMRKFNF